MTDVFRPPQADLGVQTTRFLARPLTSVGDVWSQAWRLFVGSLATISAIVLPIYLPLRLLESYGIYFIPGFANELGYSRTSLIIDGVIAALITPAVIFAVVEGARRQGRVSVREALGFGLKRWGNMFAVNLIVGLLTILGALLLVFPAIFVMLRYSLSSVIVSVEKERGWSRVHHRSGELTHGRFWLLLAIFLPTIIVPLGFGIGCGFLLDYYDHWLLSALIDIGTDVLFFFATVTAVVVYAFARFGEQYNESDDWLQEMPWVQPPEEQPIA